jgi:hypothetical protein
MFTPPEKLVQEILDQQTGLLPGIREKLTQLTQLNQIWQTQLEAQLAQHSRVANFRDHCLVIEVDSAAWVLHLRYALPDLLQQLRKFPALAELKTIEWYIRPATDFSDGELSPTRPLFSPRSAELICESAQWIKNAALKRALFKLAENVNDGAKRHNSKKPL